MKLSLFLLFFLVFIGLVGAGIQLKVNNEVGWWAGFLMVCAGKAAPTTLAPVVMNLYKSLHGGSLAKDTPGEKTET